MVYWCTPSRHQAPREAGDVEQETWSRRRGEDTWGRDMKQICGAETWRRDGVQETFRRNKEQRHGAGAGADAGF